MSYRRFLVLFLLLMASFGLIIGIFFVYLAKIYEHNPYSEIVSRQIKNKSLYGTALNEFPFPYYVELVKQRKPKVLAVGSSRSGWFKERFFNTSFVTTPKASDTFCQMENYLMTVMKFYTPEVVIIEFDPWLLLQKPDRSQQDSYGKENEMAINFSKIYASIKFALRNNMPIVNPFDTQINKNPYTDHDSLGIFAMTKANGRLVDGSRFPGILYFSYGQSDKKFQWGLWKIKNGIAPFQWARTYSSENIDILRRIIRNLKDKGIKVVSVIMPLSPIIYEEAYIKHPDKYAYWKELNDDANRLGIYDFLNPSTIDTNDCEFIDGHHPGDVASARVLKAIGERNPAFAKYLNMKQIDWAIQNRSGHAYSGKDFGKYKEVDFLELGCKKH